MQPVDLSVVIPTADRPELLRETLDSVLSQTRPPREIVVVDNGKDDRAAVLLQAYGPPVVSVRMPPLGVQAARNRGFEVSSSTWIATLDDDDLYHPTLLEDVSPVLDDGRADIVFVDHRKFVTRAGQTRRASSRSHFELAPPGYWADVPRGKDGEWSYVGRFPPGRLLRYNAFYPSTMILRKDLLQRIGGYDPALHGVKSEDLEFLSRAVPQAEMAILWKVLVDYRVHDDNDSQDVVARRAGRWRVWELVREKDQHGSPEFAWALETQLPRIRRDLFSLAFRHGDFELMREVGRVLAPEDWTSARRLKASVAALPPPLGATVVQFAGLAWPRRRRERAAFRRPIPD